MLSGRGLCDELITRPEESYRLCCVVVCDLQTSRIGAPYIYIYDISSLRVNIKQQPSNNMYKNLPTQTYEGLKFCSASNQLDFSKPLL